MVIFVLYTARDVGLAKLILNTCPIPVLVIIPNLIYSDEYNWQKTKKLRSNFNIFETIKLFKDFPRGKLKIIFSIRKLKKILYSSTLVIDRGLTFFTLKPIAKNNLALSLNRAYLNRLLDVLPYYETKQLKICMHSDIWFKDEILGNFQMDQHSYKSIKDNIKSFFGADILGHYYYLLEQDCNNTIKKGLGLPTNKKIVMVSTRMCGNPEWSVFSSDPDKFISSVKKNLVKLKNEGYFIVSRRRLGKHDKAFYKANHSPDIFRFNEISNLIDLELNGNGGFPDLLYRLLYVSDVMYMPDISGIAFVEAALMRCPVYMPHTSKWFKEAKNKINPGLLDMFNNKLIFKDLTEKSFKDFKLNINNFLSKWYRTDINRFWKKALKN